VTSVEASGRTVEEAVAAGLADLGVSRDRVEVEVLEEEVTEEGGAARVRLTVVEEPEGELALGEREGQAEPESELEYAREDVLDFLEGLLEAMGLVGEVTAEVSGSGGIEASVLGEDLGVLIGRHGRTLEAVQELVRSVVQHQATRRISVSVDVEGYRARRREALEQHAREMAERAIEEGEVKLRPMGAFERKIVHDTVAELLGVTSLSEGEEPERRVVIKADDRDEPPKEDVSR
jgi:spoIIIJ-associated protein